MSHTTIYKEATSQSVDLSQPIGLIYKGSYGTFQEGKLLIRGKKEAREYSFVTRNGVINLDGDSKCLCILFERKSSPGERTVFPYLPVDLLKNQEQKLILRTQDHVLIEPKKEWYLSNRERFANACNTECAKVINGLVIAPFTGATLATKAIVKTLAFPLVYGLKLQKTHPSLSVNGIKNDLAFGGAIAFKGLLDAAKVVCLVDAAKTLVAHQQTLVTGRDLTQPYIRPLDAAKKAIQGKFHKSQASRVLSASDLFIQAARASLGLSTSDLSGMRPPTPLREDDLSSPLNTPPPILLEEDGSERSLTTPYSSPTSETLDSAWKAQVEERNKFLATHSGKINL